MSWITGTKATLSFFAIIFFAIIFVVLSIKIIRMMNKDQSPDNKENKGKVVRLFVFGIIIAFAAKLAVAYLGPGYTPDIYCFASWSKFLVNTGISEFYETHWCNYPAGYMYILWGIGKLNAVLGLDYYSEVFGFILKLPSIISEVLLCVLVFRIAKRHVSPELSALIALAVLLIPANLVNASAWGQVDMVFILLVVLTFYLLEENRFLLGAAAFGLTMLMKTQGVFFLPVFGFAYFRECGPVEKRKKAFATLIVSFCILVITYYWLTWPYMNGQGLEWIFNNVTSSAGTYDFVSLMAHNIYTLFGVGHLTHQETLLFFSYQMWGYLFITIVSLISVWLVWKNDDKKILFLAAAFLMAGIFTFAHGMHERYILPVPTLLIVAYIYLKDMRVMVSAMLYAVFAAVNQVSALFFGQQEFYPVIAQIDSAFGLVCFAFLSYVVCVLLVKKQKKGPDLVQFVS